MAIMLAFAVAFSVLWGLLVDLPLWWSFLPAAVLAIDAYRSGKP